MKALLQHIRWRPGRNALTEERPFAGRRVRPLDGAVFSSLLGPALLLPPSLLPWLVFVLLLMLNALGFAALPGRHRLGSKSGTRSLIAKLLLLPLEAQLMLWVVSQTGLDPVIGLLDLTLLLVTHLSALLFFQGRARLPERERRRWAVQAVFWLPAVYLLLALAVVAEHLLTGLARGHVEPAALDLLQSGFPRLVLVMLGLGMFQLRTRRQEQLSIVEESLAPEKVVRK